MRRCLVPAGLGNGIGWEVKLGRSWRYGNQARLFRTVENGDGDTRKEGVEGERRPRVMTLRLAENKLESRVSRYIVHRG